MGRSRWRIVGHASSSPLAAPPKLSATDGGAGGKGGAGWLCRGKRGERLAAAAAGGRRRLPTAELPPSATLITLPSPLTGPSPSSTTRPMLRIVRRCCLRSAGDAVAGSAAPAPLPELVGLSAAATASAAAAALAAAAAPGRDEANGLDRCCERACRVPGDSGESGGVPPGLEYDAGTPSVTTGSLGGASAILAAWGLRRGVWGQRIERGRAMAAAAMRCACWAGALSSDQLAPSVSPYVCDCCLQTLNASRPTASLRRPCAAARPTAQLSVRLMELYCIEARLPARPDLRRRGCWRTGGGRLAAAAGRVERSAVARPPSSVPARLPLGHRSAVIESVPARLPSMPRNCST